MFLLLHRIIFSVYGKLQYWYLFFRHRKIGRHSIASLSSADHSIESRSGFGNVGTACHIMSEVEANLSQASHASSTTLTPARSVPDIEMDQVCHVPYQQLDSRKLLNQLSSQTQSIISDGSQVTNYSWISKLLMIWLICGRKILLLLNMGLECLHYLLVASYDKVWNF